MGYDLPLGDPRRLTLLSDVRAGYMDGRLQVTVTYTYDEWCCNGVHEVADAIKAIYTMLEESQDRNDLAAREALRKEFGLNDL